MLQRVSRLPHRFAQDLKIIKLTRNWVEILKAKAIRQSYNVIQFRNGVRLTAPPQVSLDFLFHEIWVDEFYAPAGYEIVTGDTVVDIGGNIGVFAMYAATKAEGVRVFSYEPFPQNAVFFRRNKESSNSLNVEFFEMAVASESGSRTLHVDDSWILHALADERTGEGGIQVNCTTLDAILSDKKNCDLLKIDCEGGEYEVLYSASDSTLEKVRKIVCEFNEVNEDMKCGRKLTEFLVRKGFRIDGYRMLEPGSGFICARR